MILRSTQSFLLAPLGGKNIGLIDQTSGFKYILKSNIISRPIWSEIEIFTYTSVNKLSEKGLFNYLKWNCILGQYFQ